jgi:hypothetical protein
MLELPSSNPIKDEFLHRHSPAIPPLVSSVNDHADIKPHTSPGDQVRAVLRKILPVRFVVDSETYRRYTVQSETAAMRAAIGHNITPTLQPERNQMLVVDRLARIIVAITGGVFLLVPMIIMTFVNSTNYRLIIVSVAVIWFSVSLALATNATNQELLGATAAYSAVLVVYVGTASGSSTS